MKGILFAEIEVEITFHDVDSMGDNYWLGLSVKKIKLASNLGAYQ